MCVQLKYLLNIQLYILSILFVTIFGKDVVSVDDGVSIDAKKPYNYM